MCFTERSESNPEGSKIFFNWCKSAWNYCTTEDKGFSVPASVKNGPVCLYYDVLTNVNHLLSLYLLKNLTIALA